MKKFILIDHEPWTLRRKQLFYDIFEKAGIKLLVWDLSMWLYPGMSNPDAISDEYLYKIQNENQFIKLLNQENSLETIFVVEVIRNWYNRKVFKHLSEKDFYTIKIQLYGHLGLSASWKEKIREISLGRLFTVIKHRFLNLILTFYNKYHKIKGPDRIFSSNTSSDYTDRINHPDYELFRFNIPKMIIKGKYIVFCDIFFPEHPDLKYFLNKEITYDATEYRSGMKRFFDYLESKYKMPVIIAAHPKADYNSNEWGNRKIIKYETNNLVANSEIVITHLSGSVTFAILYDKPIIFIGTDSYFEVPGYRSQMEVLTKKTLGIPYYNIDRDPFESIIEKKIDDKLRMKYINTYLSAPETYNTPTWMILKNTLSEL